MENFKPFQAVCQKVILGFIAFVGLSMSCPISAQQGPCLPVHGLSFEKVSFNQLLATRDGENIAFIRTSPLPNKLGTFRFFSSVLCTKGVEDRFHIDGQLIYVVGIERFPTLK
jgi:hypothetical protein